MYNVGGKLLSGIKSMCVRVKGGDRHKESEERVSGSG